MIQRLSSDRYGSLSSLFFSCVIFGVGRLENSCLTQYENCFFFFLLLKTTSDLKTEETLYRRQNAIETKNFENIFRALFC